MSDCSRELKFKVGDIVKVDNLREGREEQVIVRIENKTYWGNSLANGGTFTFNDDNVIETIKATPPMERYIAKITEKGKTRTSTNPCYNSRNEIAYHIHKSHSSYLWLSSDSKDMHNKTNITLASNNIYLEDIPKVICALVNFYKYGHKPGKKETNTQITELQAQLDRLRNGLES